MNAATISRAIKANTNIDKSTTAKGRVSDVTSEGFICKQIGHLVEIRYIASSLNYSDKGWEEFKEKESGAMYLIAKILTRKGYQVAKYDHKLIVQSNYGK